MNTTKATIYLVTHPDGQWSAWCYPLGATEPFTSDLCDSAVTAAAACAEKVESAIFNLEGKRA